MMKKKAFVLLFALTAGISAAGFASAETKTVTVGTIPGTVGTTFVDSAGKVTGFEIEVLREAGRRSGHSFTFKTMDFGSLFAALSSKKVDLVVANLQYSPERARKYLFTKETYYKTPYKLTVRNDDTKTRSFNDLNGKKVAVLGTGLQYPALKSYVERHSLDIEILPIKAATEVMNLLTSKRVDAAFIPEYQTYTFSRYAGANIKAIGQGILPLNATVDDVGARYMFRKDSTELRDQIDAALSAMKQDGTLKKLSIQWFGVDFTKPLLEKDIAR